jgi:hypothetical protein
VLAAIGLLLAVAIVGAVVARWISAPGRCEHATFTSNRFGYCLVAPAGWSGDDATVGTTKVDELTLKEEPATVFVQAVTLGEGQSLNDFVNAVRQLDEKAGYQLGEVRPRQIDGVDGAQWDVTVSPDAGSNAQEQKLRVVVFVHDGSAWRVQLGDTADGFANHIADLDQMLDSWRFR